MAIRAGVPVLHRDVDFDVLARHTELQTYDSHEFVSRWKADPADGKVNVQLLESNIEWESVE